MRIRLRYLTVTAATYMLLLIAAPGLVVADDKPPQTQAEAPAAKPKLICRYEHVVGSNIKKKRCLTPAQADAIRQASQESLDQMRSRSTEVGGTGG